MNNNREEALYLVIIANSVFPYGYDAARILCLPQDSTYRARFNEDFVSSQVKRDFRHLPGRAGYYCFRDYGSGRLIPLRMISIVEITLIGSVYYIEYSLSDIFDFPQNPASLDDQVESFNDQFSRLHKNEIFEHFPGGDLRPLVLMSRLLPEFHGAVETVTDDYDRETRRWAAAARLLGAYEYFNYVPFIRIVGLRGNLADATIRVIDGNIVLASNEDYRLQVAHNLQSDSLTPHSINENRTERQPSFIQRASFQLELRADPSVIDIQDQRIFITGQYDVNHFYFRTRDFVSARSTTLTIDYIEKPPSVRNLDTKISLTLKMRPKSRFPAGRLLFALCLVALYAIPNLYPVIFQYLAVDQRVVQDVTIVALSLTLFDLVGEFRRYLTL
jgi:hypothetical protein